ncbi:MAG: GNAT family N-acetyltransferase [Candidatus Gracilibacteria bacterium]
MEIRNLKEEDIELVIALTKNCEELVVERTSIYWLFSKFFSNTSFVAVENGDIIGLLLGLIDQTVNKTGFIHALGVSAKFRKKGIASALIEKFETAIQQLGGSKFCLTAVPENTNATQFYENRHFTEKTEIYKVGQKRIQFCKNIVPSGSQ